MKTFFYGKNEAFLFRFILTRSLEKTILLHLILVVVPTFILSVINYGSDVLLFAVRAIQIVVFIVLGTFYSSLFLRNLYQRRGNYIIPIARFLSIPALVSCALLLTQFFTSEGVLFQALALICAYLVPLPLLHAWHLFYFIEQQKIKVGFDEDVSPVTKANVYLGSVSLQVLIEYDEFQPDICFSLYAPLHAKLGKLILQSFLEEMNDPEISSHFIEKNKHFGWIFYLQTLNGSFKNYFDPKLSILENKIKSGAIIHARPVKLLTKTSKLVSDSYQYEKI